MAPLDLETNFQNENVITLCVKQETSRNLLIHAAAHNAVHKSAVIPAHELKNMQQEITNSKGLKLTKRWLKEKDEP